MANIITLFLLLALSFVMLPFGTSYFEIPKVEIAELAIALLLFISILQDTHFSRFNRKLLVLTLLLALVAVINLLLRPTTLTLFGNAFRMQGTYLLLNLLIWVLLSSKIPLKMASVSSILPIYVLFVTTLLLGANSSGRAIGPLGEPNSLAAVAVVFWVFSSFSHFKNFRLERINIIASTASVAVIIFLSGSRSALVAFLLQLALLGLVKLMQFSIRKSVILVLLLLFATFILPFLDINYRYENRAQIWETALVAGLEHQPIGVGFGNLETVMTSVGYRLKTTSQYAYVDSAHNIFLDFWVDSGVVGLGILIVLIYLTFSNYIKKKDLRNLMILVGLLTPLSFNPMSSAILVIFWWAIGQSFYFPKLD